MEPEKIPIKPLDTLPVKELDTSELPYPVPDFQNDEVLDYLTDELADFIEFQGDKDIYKERLKGIAGGFTDKLKLPGILKWIRNLVVNYIVSWLYEHALDIVIGFLRGLGRKQ